MLRTALCLALTCLASASEWTVGWQAAAAAAAEAKLPILADFTGSDWCPACKLLKKEVFDTPEFAAWAKGRVVLLEVDLPLKSTLSAAQQAENETLNETHKVEGYPTILLLTAEGRELGRLNYLAGGPAVWTAAADRILAGAR